MRADLPRLLSEGDEGTKVLCIGWMVLFCMRRFEECLVLHAHVLSQHMCMPPVALRCVSASVVVELVLIGRLNDARAMFAPLEEMYALSHDDLMPPDLLLRNVAKAVLCDDIDTPQVLACTREIIRIARHMPLLPLFHLPCMLEVIASRLLHLLEPATDEASLFASSYRNDMEVIVDQLIEVIATFIQWPLINGPVIQRLRGWRAYTLGNTTAASNHLNQSLMDAECNTDVPLLRQFETTLDLMERLGVCVTYVNLS